MQLYTDKYKDTEDKFLSLFDAVLDSRGKEMDCPSKLLLDTLDGNISNGNI